MARPELEEFQRRILGRRCDVTRHEYSWGLRFDGRGWITIECFWRIISNGRIVFGSGDNGHQFGLPAPVDGEAVARSIFGLSPLTNIVVHDDTADLQLHFQNGARLEIINNSAGYEGWQAGYSDGGIETELIGCGGGEIALVTTRNAT